MGTRTFGTAAGNNSHYFYISGSATSMKADAYLNAPEDMYVDGLWVYASTQDGNNAVGTNALYLSNGNKIFETPAFTLGTGAAWVGQTMSIWGITSGSSIGAAIETGPHGLTMYALLDGNPFDYAFSTNLPNPWSGGTTKTGWGGLAWYVSYFPTATITSISPTHGQQGASVNVYGRSFGSGIGNVYLNGQACSWTYINDGQVNITVPAGATSGGIQVFTNAQNPTSGTFTVDPVITSVSPTHGAPGNTITINGSGFTGISGVVFSNGSTGISASFTVNSDTQVTATIPSGAVTGPLSINKSGGTTATWSNFTIDSTLTSFSPTAGGVGTAVTLTGVGFTGASAVKFNGTSASFTVVSDTSITTTVPNGATSGPISVTCTGGTATSGSNFVVAPGWFHNGGTINRLKGIWYHTGGVLQPVKGIWYHSGGIINPLK